MNGRSFRLSSCGRRAQRDQKEQFLGLCACINSGMLDGRLVYGKSDCPKCGILGLTANISPVHVAPKSRRAHLFCKAFGHKFMNGAQMDLEFMPYYFWDP